MASHRRFCIGYALLEKKKQSFLQASLINRADSQGVDFIAIDLQAPLSQQGPFDAILHKLPGNAAWKHELIKYAASHPWVIIVDPPVCIERLYNRISMLQVVAELHVPEEFSATVGIPKQCVLDGSSNGIELAAGLGFPAIAKPLMVDGSVKSHAMSLVFSIESLAKLKPPLVLQEFINHGGVIFKVYVVGDYVQCVSRPSLPDVDEKQMKDANEPMSFCQISNSASSVKSDLPSIELPPFNLMTSIASGLRKALGLCLFNFDIIRDMEVGNHYHIIDINYFPGYAKMPAYEMVLTDFFRQLADGCAASS